MNEVFQLTYHTSESSYSIAEMDFAWRQGLLERLHKQLKSENDAVEKGRRRGRSKGRRLV